MTKTPGDIILLHFCTTNEDHMMYCSWDIRQDRVFCHSGPFFALWPTPKHSENQNFEKLKKPLGDITILHMCPSNDNHMMYCSWDMECDRQYFILGHFLPFYPTKNLKNKIFSKIEKKKTPGNVIILHLCTTNDNHMMYGSWYMEHDTEFFVMADYFLHFHPPNNPWKSKFWKNEKNSMRYYYFTHVQHKWKS